VTPAGFPTDGSAPPTNPRKYLGIAVVRMDIEGLGHIETRVVDEPSGEIAYHG
jgi:hypothetical protein